MACTLPRPAPQALFDSYSNMFSSTVLGGAPVIAESNEFYAVGMNYAMAEQFYAITEQAWQQRDPRTACAEALGEMAADDGVYPLAATPAQGYLKLSGTANTTLTVPLEFTVGDTTYTTAVDASQPTQLNADGAAVVRVRALVAGEVGNIKETTGTLNTAIAGVNAAVEVCGGTFCGGTDAETTTAFRARYINRLQYQPRATQQWLLDKLMEWPCATRALPRAGSCCQCNDCGGSDCADCDCNDCGGKMEFYLMFDGSFDCGIAPASVIDEVQEWLFGAVQGYGQGQVEIGVCGRVVAVCGVQMNVGIDIADCVTARQLSEIEKQIAEYFTTIAPSQPVRKRAIDVIIANIVGVDVNFEATFSLVNELEGEGTECLEPTECSKVYVGGCDFEPNCDVLLCLNAVNISTGGANAAGCP